MRFFRRPTSPAALPQVVAVPAQVPRLVAADAPLRSLYQEFLAEPVPRSLVAIAERLDVDGSTKG
jgi:hypothetical protein